jgi:hypothetical protein
LDSKNLPKTSKRACVTAITSVYYSTYAPYPTSYLALDPWANPNTLSQAPSPTPHTVSSSPLSSSPKPKPSPKPVSLRPLLPAVISATRSSPYFSVIPPTDPLDPPDREPSPSEVDVPAIVPPEYTPTSRFSRSPQPRNYPPSSAIRPCYHSQGQHAATLRANLWSLIGRTRRPS